MTGFIPGAGWEPVVPALADPSATSGAAVVAALAAPASTGKGVRIVFKGLSYTVPSNHNRRETVTLLKDVCGCFEPGLMTAVMGPSGSGKTTFLDLLAGRKTIGSVSGNLLFGHEAPTSNFLRRFTGYVEQFDTLVDNLTVYEMLLYTAELKRPMSEPLASKRGAVDVLLQRLALEKCRDTRIGSTLKRGISGGQAKRTNVGIALITNPRVLFLDEPTTGLDSYTSIEVMEVVKGLADADGTTICATIHSPSSACFALFDRVMIMASGWLVYYGHNGVPASDYLSKVCGAPPLVMGENLAEWMMAFLTQADREGRSQALHDSYNMSPLGKATAQHLENYHSEAASYHPSTGGSLGCPSPSRTRRQPSQPPQQPLQVDGVGGAGPGTGGRAGACAAAGSERASGAAALVAARRGDGVAYVTPTWWSLRVLIQYRTLRNYRAMDYLGPRMFDKVIFAVVIMSLYWSIGDSFKASNIPSMAALMYLCVAQPAWGAVAYVPNIMSERALYVREQNDGLYRPVTYLVFKMADELTLNFIVGLGSTAIIFYGVMLEGSFAYFWLNCMCTLSNGVVIAYAIAALSSSLDIANATVPTVLAIMLFLSGFLIRIEDIPLYWRWLTYANLLRYSWEGLMINQFDAHRDAELGGTPILTYFHLETIDKWQQLGIIAAFFAGWSVVAWAALAFVKHQQR